ncbi:hypothetical protein ACVWZ3_010072 [Bradyrhizobium sp. i1.3.6]
MAQILLLDLVTFLFSLDLKPETNIQQVFRPASVKEFEKEQPEVTNVQTGGGWSPGTR